MEELYHTRTYVMKVSPPFRYLFVHDSAPARSSLRRKFHCSHSVYARPDPRYPSIKASKQDLAKANAQKFGPYSDAQKAAVSELYTPEQVAAIEAGEAAIDPQDLATQGTIREDSFALPYLDDLSNIHPVVDKPVRAPETNYDPNLRFKTEDEIAQDYVKWFRRNPDPENDPPESSILDNMRLTIGKEEAERNPRSYLAPAIPKIDSLLAPKKPNVDGKEVDPGMMRLMRQTGFTNEEIRRFRVKQLISHRVVNQTRLGKIQSMYFLTVAGNGRGLLGIGEGKSAEPADARKQAQYAAIRNLQPVPRYEERTIFGDVKGKVGATELELMTRPPGIYRHALLYTMMLLTSLGFGLRCQAYIFEMCRCAGIQDLAARVTRSRNPMNTVKAAFQALMSQRLPEDEARARGKKLVDIRKVYYGGFV